MGSRGGKKYYIRSRRVDGRVLREYVGGGIAGEYAAELDAEARARRQHELDRDRELQQQEEEFDKEIDELITKNPFKAQGLSTSQTAAQKAYVTWSQIEKVIEHCPTDEWKLLFALVRSIPTRIPSELEELTWSDVDWEANTILIHSPKTRDIGKFARLVPIFDTLKPYLETMFFKSDTELYIFPTLRLNTNPGTSAKKIVTKSKQKLWPNFFNSLRASTLTDLMDQHGLRKACKWAGNSAAVAMKCYALTRSDDFDDNGKKGQETSIKSDAKSDAILPADAKSDAIPASTTEQKPNKKTHCRESWIPTVRSSGRYWT